jgi:hypothetical protein
LPSEFFKPVYYKGKSDVITTPLDADNAEALLTAVAKTGTVDAICDSYGGAIADVADDATAFVHRSRTLFNLQYYTEWASDTDCAGALQIYPPSIRLCGLPGRVPPISITATLISANLRKLTGGRISPVSRPSRRPMIRPICFATCKA